MAISTLEDMPKWFTYDEVAASPQSFAYHLDEKGFEELLAYMKQNRNRYVPR